MRLNVKLVVLSVLFCLAVVTLNGFAQVEVPFKAELPIAMTNPGQSPENAIVGLLAKRAGIEIHGESFLKPEQLEGFKTLILIIGGSGKGLGSAGVDLPSEHKRAEELIKTAKEKGMKIIGMHLGGAERRGDASKDMIDLITPVSDYVVVRADGNQDGYFTQLCEANNVPLSIIEATTEVTDVLKALFVEE